MKVWASASAIGLGLAYFAGCSVNTPDDNQFMGGGTSTGGTAPGTAGTGTAGTGTAGTGTAGTGGVGTAGSTATAGTGGATTAGTGGVGTAGGGAGGVGTAGGGTGGVGTAGGGTGGGGTAGSGCPAGVIGHCTEATYPEYPGYKLALVEDFGAPLNLDTDPVWTWSDGSPADGQTMFKKDNIAFANGKMTITAAPPAGCASSTTNAACTDPYQSYGEAQAPKAKNDVGQMGVVSGELRSKYNNYRYGRYEVKFQAPLGSPEQATTNNASGFLSTMFVFRTPKNVVWNEIDFELEPNFYNHIQGNIVSKTFPGNADVGYPGGNASPLDVAGPANYHIAQEHVYAFNWTPTEVEWFMDGVSLRKFQGSGNVPIPALSAKIMMNLWVFSGDHFGPSAKNQYPMVATYDWFRFYKLDDAAKEPTYPCANPPACLPAADKTASSQNNPMEVNYGK